MRLSELVAAFAPGARVSCGSPDVDVTALAFDSRKVGPGALFFAVPGTRLDGVAFARDAVARGAVGVVSEKEADLGVPLVVVPDVRRALGLAADAIHGQPSRDVQAFGVTGTNGKTTTTYLLRSILAAAGARPSLLGTVGYEVAGRTQASTNTTPDPITIHSALAATRASGGRALVMECSSHALDQQRVAGVRFAAGVFTNLSRDHLDYHVDGRAYFEAKSRLFRGLGPDAYAILNDRDPASRELATLTRANVIRFGGSARCRVRARVHRSDLGGTRATLLFDRTAARLDLPLVGRHNVENALAAAAAAWAVGVPVDAIVRGLESVRHVPGRVEPVRVDDLPGAPRILVDYAHTPEALEKVLGYLEPLVRGRLLVVFGCGGDRDRGKRPLMAAAVERHADLAVVTSDNPRTEDPGRILDEVVAGFRSRDGVRVLADRREAIFEAVRSAGEEDLLVIAGKGHETGQVTGREVLPFDDREVAREALLARRSRAPLAG